MRIFTLSCSSCKMRDTNVPDDLLVGPWSPYLSLSAILSFTTVRLMQVEPERSVRVIRQLEYINGYEWGANLNQGG